MGIEYNIILKSYLFYCIKKQLMVIKPYNRYYNKNKKNQFLGHPKLFIYIHTGIYLILPRI